MLSFAYVYFLESGLFNELWAIQIKKFLLSQPQRRAVPNAFPSPSSGSGVGPSFDDWEYLYQLILVLARNCRRVGQWPNRTWRAAPSKEALPLQLRCRAE